MLQLRRPVRVGVDLLVHPVDVIRHNVVDVHCPGFPVSQAAAHHHDDLKREIFVSGCQGLLHVGEGWDDHLFADVFRFLDALHRVVRHSALVIRVPEDRLEDAEDIHLVSAPHPVRLQFVQEARDHNGRNRVQFPRPETRDDVHVNEAVHVPSRRALRHLALTRPPLLRVFHDRLLTEFAANLGDRWRRCLLLCVDLRETLDRVVLRVVAGLFTLLTESVPEPNRIRVRTTRRPGTTALLEERPHPTSELSSHVSSLPNRAMGGPADPSRTGRSASRTPFDSMLTVC
ncbi:hypothetical protein SUDANB32_00486 [Streptomyces sp. enrichment culture]